MRKAGRGGSVLGIVTAIIREKGYLCGMEDSFKKTITLADAVKMTGPAAFNIMLKPAGSLCNLDCRYCYYLDKASLYGGREPIMSEELLEKVISDYIGSCDVPEVTFNWHGGEPLLAGIDFYRKAIALERKYADGKVVHNTLQTNGTLVTPEWADLFASNGFLVGISIDGPQYVHDAYRSSKTGIPSFDKVMRGLVTLIRGGVQFNTLTAVSKASEGRGVEIYQFLKSLGSQFMQFLPVVEKVRYQVNAKGRRVDNARPSVVAPRIWRRRLRLLVSERHWLRQIPLRYIRCLGKDGCGAVFRRDVRRHIGFILRSDSGNVLILRDLRLQCSGRAQWRCLCVRPFRVPGISAGQRILVEPQDNDAVRQGCVIRHRQAQFSSVSMSPLRMGASLQRRMS